MHDPSLGTGWRKSFLTDWTAGMKPNGLWTKFLCSVKRYYRYRAFGDFRRADSGGRSLSKICGRDQRSLRGSWRIIRSQVKGVCYGDIKKKGKEIRQRQEKGSICLTIWDSCPSLSYLLFLCSHPFFLRRGDELYGLVRQQPGRHQFCRPGKLPVYPVGRRSFLERFLTFSKKPVHLCAYYPVDRV